MAEEKKTLMGLRRGIEVLRILSRHPGGCTFTELQEATGDLPAPTLSRLMKALVDEELATKDADHGRYLLGKTMVVLAQSVLGSTPREEILHPVLVSLAERTRESSAYFEREADHLVLLDKVERAESHHYMSVMGRNTQFAHGFYQVILAFLPDDTRERLVSGVSEWHCGKREWKRRLKEARKNGVYFEDEDLKPGMCRFAAPVLCGNDGEVVGSIGVTFHKAGADENRLAELSDLVARAGKQATDMLQS